MLRRFLPSVCALTLVATGLALPTPARAATLDSYVMFHALGADPLGSDGLARGADNIAVSGSADSTIDVTANQPAAGRTYHLRFAAPQGQTLTVGTYNGARDLDSRGATDPAVEIVQDGRSTCTSTGTFEVRDLAPDLSHFWIAFERRCPSAGGLGAFGEVRYNLPGDPELFVGAAEMLWPQQQYSPNDRFTGVPVQVVGANPVTFQSFTITGPGAAAFGVSNDYCTTLPPDQSCGVFITYHPTLPGRREATLTIKDSTSAGAHSITLVDPGLAADDPALVAAVGSPPDPVIDLYPRADFNSVTLAWTNPTTVDWADTIVRMLPGTRPPATATEGAAIYTGRGTTARVDNLQLGTSYSFAVFSRDAEGLVAQPATSTVAGVDFRFPPPPRRMYGGQYVLFGVVRDVVSGAGVGPAPVQAIATDPRTGAVLMTVDGRTTDAGAFGISITALRTYRWTIKARGDQAHLGGISAPVLAPIKSKVTLTPATNMTVRAGKTLKIVGRALPINTGEPLRLQELVKGKWKTLLAQKPDTTGATTFTVKPAKGTHTYRVWRADTPAADSNPSSTVKVRAT